MALDAVTARRSMIPEIARLMDAHFKEDAAFFTRLVGLHWDFGYDEIGSVLTDDGRIVGYFGLHHSCRMVRGKLRAKSP